MLLVTLQEHCLLGTKFSRVDSRMKTYATSRNLFADRLTELPFPVKTFKIIVFMSYRHKMEYNCCRVSISVFQKTELFNIWVSSSKVSQKDLPMVAFVIVHVYFTADYGKNLFNISKFWSSCSSTGRHKMKYSWYQERFFCYSKLSCLFSLAWETLRSRISTKVKLNMHDFNGLETKISRTFLDFLDLGHEFYVISGHGT